jgi:hypothetical protein
MMGETYITHETAARKMQLKNWTPNRFRSTKNLCNNVYKVVGIFDRSIYNTRDILGISNEIESFVIGPRGVKLISRPPLIPEEAKAPQLFDINHLYPYIDIAE